MTKTCSKCKRELGLSAFNKRKNRPDGLRSECRHCQAAYRKINFEANKEKQLAQSRDWKKANWEQVLEYSSEWKKKNRAQATATQMKRHARKVSTEILKGDEWNDFFIQEVYDLCKLRSDETGIKWHVDHILPLQGKTVTGLHVWNNLQVIPASINCSKSNRLI